MASDGSSPSWGSVKTLPWFSQQQQPQAESRELQSTVDMVAITPNVFSRNPKDIPPLAPDPGKIQEGCVGKVTIKLVTVAAISVL